jgi:hypothetical protein
MRKITVVLLGVALLALVPSSAIAQDKKVHINFGGGPTFPAGKIGDHFKTGWGPAIGVTVDSPNPRLSFQFEYAYRWMGISDNADVPTPLVVGNTFSANHQTHQLDFNLVSNLTRPGAPARVYAVLGPGAYYRQVEITKYEGNGVICDPYWYVCGTYPVESVLGSRGGWDFGFNIGGGVGFGIGDSAEFIIESRFHYVAGKKIEPNATQLPAGVTIPSDLKTTGYYWPLTFGFRF